MHITPPRRTLGRLWPVALTLAAAMAIVSTPASAQPDTAVSNARDARTTQDGSEIDGFMERVFANRDAASWRRLGDFVLRETCVFELEAPPGAPLSGFRREREYEWYVHDGVAARSPARVDRIGIDDATRRGYEQAWLAEEERRRAGLDRGDPEPRFITDFGRETVASRDVVRIEFYPTGPFGEEAGERIKRGLIKTSMVTLWVDPEIHR